MARLSVLIVLAALLGTAGSAPAEAARLPGGAPLTRALVDQLLGDALRADGAGEHLRLLIEEPRLPLANQAGQATEITVEALSYDASSGRFQALLVGRIGDRTRFRLPTRGRAQSLIEAPVLVRPLAAGERIAADDVGWITIAPNRIRPGAVIDAGQLIGAEARRALPPGRLLTGRDLQTPRLVERGRPVRLIYARPGLRLTALGIAQADGGLGDSITVLNPDSRRQVQGLVTGPGQVTLGTTGGLPATP